MCGRCSGHLDAVALTWRPPNQEVATLEPNAASRWDAALIVVGMIGLAMGAFHWSASPWFVQMKLAAAGYVIDHGPQWLLADNAPWWLLTHYPDANDVFTWLDGALIISYIVATAAVVSGAVALALWTAVQSYRGERAAHWNRLTYALIPLAGFGVFLGLTSLTVSLARAEGLSLTLVPWLRAIILAVGAAWSLQLAWRQLADVDGLCRRGCAPCSRSPLALRWWSQRGGCCFSAGVRVGFAGGLLPAFRAARKKIVDALLAA